MPESKRPGPADGPAESARPPRSHRPHGHAADETASPAEWMARKGTRLALHAGAMAHAGWLENSPLTESEYDDAIDAAQNVELR